MECKFAERKRELEREFKIPVDVFEKSRERLERFLQPFLLAFKRSEQETHAAHFVTGLLSNLETKNTESIAYHHGLDRRGLQHFIGE